MNNQKSKNTKNWKIETEKQNKKINNEKWKMKFEEKKVKNKAMLGK